MLENELIDLENCLKANYGAIRKIIGYQFEGKLMLPSRKVIAEGMFDENRWAWTIQNLGKQNAKLREKGREIRKLLGISPVGRPKGCKNMKSLKTCL